MSDGKLVILSDLHLWGPEDPLYRALLRFIDDKLETGDKFFIVGDLFDLFVGNKRVFRERFHELIRRLRGLGAKNVEVFYIEGNHDFQIESLFDDCAHVKIYSDVIHFDWDGRKFHFCHGDRINTRDLGYQAFRLLTRNILVQCLIEAIPGGFIDRVGGMMSKASRGYHPDPDERVARMFRNYACEQISGGYDFVIMGHSHHLDDMRFRVGGHEGQYVNCGYPRKHRKYIELRKGQAFFEMKSWEDLVIPLRPVQKSAY
ncbi:MAG: UDP-2,3-diacylglucosamine diphosphatase [Deltaproteobacteria bacterium]|nr:UDP-2,3-diacylglucosamine diphosphatase [Deltaproteobacteria bacterium]